MREKIKDKGRLEHILYSIDEAIYRILYQRIISNNDEDNGGRLCAFGRINFRKVMELTYILNNNKKEY